ncbi:uncharacterized protein LOC111249974 isoform X1 [Varroa destructor]|uniref:Platelet-derived growth factor (PDGF) family profile domain-containing protein n=1 Tax=Varroa destructor TaxID=109461 RepID=A0A7M7K1Z0_VARDE|nr:uncharacterized protein LOC111249974 isoform X1 [Varroa destructor]
MQYVVLFSGLCLCSVAYGYERSISSRSSRYLSSPWGSRRHRHSSSHALPRSSASLSKYNTRISEDIRTPKRFDSYVPILNTPPTDDARLQKEYPLGTSRGLRRPNRNSFAVDIKLVKAEKHFFEMEVRAACASPRERVICVQDHYPDADIIYQPACTILHRCDEHSGCCEPPKKCQSASSEQVALFFKTSDTTIPVIKFDFTNHTSCRCDVDEIGAVAPAPPEVSHLDSGHELEIEEHFDDELQDEFLMDSTLNSCPRCPRLFSKRFERGLCKCDCFDGDSLCKSIKSGREKLSEEERRCIQRNACNKPTCAAGHYFNVDFGECRKPSYEKLTLSDEEKQALSSSLLEGESDLTTLELNKEEKATTNDKDANLHDGITS